MIEVILHARVMKLDEKYVPLTLRQAQILWVLARKAGAIVSLRTLIEHCWSADDEPVYPRDSIQVALTYLRRLLAPLGLTIECRPQHGYRLVEAA